VTDELLLLTTGSLQNSLLARLAKRADSEISESTLATELQEREAAGSKLSTFLEGSLITAAVDVTGIAVSVGSWRLEAEGDSKGSESWAISAAISNEAAGGNLVLFCELLEEESMLPCADGAEEVEEAEDAFLFLVSLESAELITELFKILR
jgi:hypothetical protein